MNEKIIANKTFDKERELYLCDGLTVENCTFEGPTDGESPLKENSNLTVNNSTFALRYSLWHVNNGHLTNCAFTDKCRAAFWYCSDIKMEDSQALGVKAFRECNNVTLQNCKLVSEECFWRNNNLKLINTSLEGFYPFFQSSNIVLQNFELKGKYSFQYVEKATIIDSKLDTKDAFWHSKDVEVKNCDIKGEYIGWYSENLTLINCKISGTQPFCYCKNLKLINCELENADLAFEYSSVDADIKSDVISIKNPSSGKIVVNSVKEIIKENSKYPCNCEIIIRNK